MGPTHRYGIARRIEQTSGDRLSVNYGTLYPALRKLEQKGSIASRWGVSGNRRKAKFYKLKPGGGKNCSVGRMNGTRPRRSSPSSLRRVRSPHEDRSCDTNSFQVLGQRPIVGRDSGPSDGVPGAPAVALLNYA
jgi:hypothetical protein